MAIFQPNKGMLIQPDTSPESAWTGHIPFAGWLTEATRPKILVELGTHRGASYLAFCQALAEGEHVARAYAVDTWMGDEHAGQYGDEVFARLRDYHDARYAGFSKLMRMTFDEASNYFDDASVDVLHIDGLHTYEAVRHDFETWLPKLSDEAVVLFHDIGVRERDFGVWRFWSECRDRYPSFEFLHSHGLGVLVVGARASESVRALAGLESEDRAFVAGLFSRLGSAADDRLERQRLADALAHEYDRADRRAAGAVFSAITEQHAILRQDLAHIQATSLQSREALLKATADARQDLANIQATSLQSREALLQATAEARQDLANIQASSIEDRAAVMSAMADARQQLIDVVGGVETVLLRQAELGRAEAEVRVADVARVLRELVDVATRSDKGLDTLGDLLVEIRARVEASQVDVSDVRGALERIEGSRLPARLKRLFGRQA